MTAILKAVNQDNTIRPPVGAENYGRSLPMLLIVLSSDILTAKTIAVTIWLVRLIPRKLNVFPKVNVQFIKQEQKYAFYQYSFKYNLINNSLTTVFGAHKVMAQVNCATIPDCASLGYSSTESSCNGSWLYCPFNSAYKKCVPSSASCEGFTKDDKTSWCKTIVPCAGDDTLTLCSELLTKDCSSYTLDKCGDYDVCESCSDGSGTTKYKITGCKNNKMIITTIKGVEGCYEYYDSCEDAGFYTMLDSKPCGDPSAFALSASGGFHACYAEECLTCKTTC